MPARLLEDLTVAVFGSRRQWPRPMQSSYLALVMGCVAVIWLFPAGCTRWGEGRIIERKMEFEECSNHKTQTSDFKTHEEQRDCQSQQTQCAVKGRSDGEIRPQQAEPSESSTSVHCEGWGVHTAMLPYTELSEVLSGAIKVQNRAAAMECQAQTVPPTALRELARE